ncbi:MAG: UPF0280 family protein [Syntrophaceae bacterium]|nr:UPF0280 family protein [Syntrophaceae bacterium]
MRPSVIIEEPRSYRTFDPQQDLKSFRVTVETSDLYVKAFSELSEETQKLIHQCRSMIKRSIEARPEFMTSLVPIDVEPDESVVTTRMIKAGQKAGVGPMASVAGAVADYVGRGLLEFSSEVIVENGGDLFISVNRSIVVGVYAGSSPFSNKVGLKVGPTPVPLGIGTSSGTVGPSKSFGKADAATIVSHDPILADAAATALGNKIRTHRDISSACKWAMSLDGVIGCLAILGDKMAALGKVELVSIE